MSLFPAYSKNASSNNKDENTENSEDHRGGRSWLRNSSFNQSIASDKVTTFTDNAEDNLIKSDNKSLKNYDIKEDVTELLSSSIESDDNAEKLHCSGSSSERMSKNRKKKKKKEKKNKKEKKKKKSDDGSAIHRDKTSADILTEVPGLFYTDKRREPGNLNVETLYRPAVPLYDRPKRKLVFSYSKSSKENSKKYRYYTFSHKLYKKSDMNEGDTVEESIDTKEVGVNCEKELMEKTRQFNEKLELDPNNIDLWLEYVRFQDRICKYEQVFSSSKSNAKKVSAEKKIAILEKAISINPLCEELLNEKFGLAEIVYPPGKLLNEAMELINKDKTNITLCRTVIRCSQFSLARCTTPGVMKAFSDALERLHQTRMRHLSNKYSETTKRITKIMLVLLLECGLFMRQAGLWEQLIALFKQYLEMNVSNCVAEFHESYKFNVSINEEPIYNSEETILQSNLPLSAIWLRIERLRETCHWLPLSSNDSSDDDKNIDPQRFVFIDDIRYLVQPILPSSLNLHLVVTFIYLMKIPVLPAKHMVFEILHLNEIPYGMDAVENILPVFFPVGLVPVNTDKHFLKDIHDLISGPQYVNNKLGKSEFLLFIGMIFESASKQLGEPEAVALYSWYLRFNRLLAFLSRLKEDITYDDAHKKKIKKFAKERLKEPQFRNELQLYNEYSLLERDFGNDEQCLNVLHTAIKFRRFTYEKATYVALYRNIAETLLRANPNENRLKVIDILCSLVDSNSVETATEKFKHVNTETLSSLFSSVELLKEIELIDLMTPHWFIEWIACHSYFLMLTKSVWAASSMVQDILDSMLPNISPCTIGKLICEGLYEILVSVLHFHCQQTNTSFHVLQDVLHSAHKMFANNLYFLHTLSLIETSAGSAGSPWWKLLSSFTVSNSALPRLFLVFILRHRISISIQEVGWSDTSGHNLMFSLLDRLINDDISKKCPLIWRLYLQFLSVSKRECNLKNAFYRAVEECPWIKAIYVDAIQLLPENIQEIQDLLIEKELRLHSVMDELEILRDGNV